MTDPLGGEPALRHLPSGSRSGLPSRSRSSPSRGSLLTTCAIRSSTAGRDLNAANTSRQQPRNVRAM
jgi:hypothetical protein